MGDSETQLKPPLVVLEKRNKKVGTGETDWGLFKTHFGGKRRKKPMRVRGEPLKIINEKGQMLGLVSASQHARDSTNGRGCLFSENSDTIGIGDHQETGL